MKWEPDGKGYKVSYKKFYAPMNREITYEILVRPFGDKQWFAKIGEVDSGYTYSTQQYEKMEDAAKRAFAVIDAR